MKNPSTLTYLAIAILLLAIADIVLAINNSFLEGNIGLVWLYSKLGPIWAWAFIIGLKFLLIIGLIWILFTNKYKTERYMFFVMSLFAFMLIAQAYGAYTGVRAIVQVGEYEEEHGPLSLEAKDMIRFEVKDKAVKTYPTTTFWISIFPLVIANLSFYIFEKLYPNAEIKRRRWKDNEI